LIKKPGENNYGLFKNNAVNIDGINGHLPTRFIFSKAFLKLKLILQRVFDELNCGY